MGDIILIPLIITFQISWFEIFLYSDKYLSEYKPIKYKDLRSVANIYNPTHGLNPLPRRDSSKTDL